MDKQTRTKKTRAHPAEQQAIMSIEQLLTELRTRGAILCYSKRNRVVLWSPGVCIPLRYRQAVAYYNRELRRLMGVSDPRVCPSPALHQHASMYVVRRWTCPYCAQLAPSVAGKSVAS